MRISHPVLELGPGFRELGVIVTAEHDDGPPLLSFHEPGKVPEAVLRACDRIDRLGGGWRIVSMSTPRSIYRCLQGERRERVRFSDKSRRLGEEYDLRETERRLLLAAGRIDLLKPSRFVTPARADAIQVGASVEHFRDGTRIGGNA